MEMDHRVLQITGTRAFYSRNSNIFFIMMLYLFFMEIISCITQLESTVTSNSVTPPHSLNLKSHNLSTRLVEDGIKLIDKRKQVIPVRKYQQQSVNDSDKRSTVQTQLKAPDRLFYFNCGPNESRTNETYLRYAPSCDKYLLSNTSRCYHCKVTTEYSVNDTIICFSKR